MNNIPKIIPNNFVDDNEVPDRKILISHKISNLKKVIDLL